MAKYELGTKRVDPETGRKFYDLNKDPIVSPYTGRTYPRSYFDEDKATAILDDEEDVDQKDLSAENENAEVMSLEDADDAAKGNSDSLPDLGDDSDVDLGDDDNDTFLADEEEGDEDVSDMISVGDDEDEDDI